ncbi:MAG: hypothetical protein KKC46_16775 [Proteobacteria bacterium]|nr:hypothetical protein [Pseudomonadota bacterium]
MKRLLLLMAAVFFILCASSFAAAVTEDELVAISVKSMGKETKMSATGKVTELSDSMLKIDRRVKGKTEAMEFTLEKACSGISIGDKVKISYINKDDKNIAARVMKMQKKAKHHAKKKAAVKKEIKPVEEAEPTPANE